MTIVRMSAGAVVLVGLMFMPLVAHSDIKRLYPTGRGFSDVVIASGQRHIFISGQVAFDGTGVVGKGDIAAQTEQVMKNITRALKASGASVDDLVKITIFVVDYTPEKRDLIQSVRDRHIPADGGPASTLIGVSRLVSDEFLIEIEAQAITSE